MFKGKPAAPAPRPETPETLYLSGGLGRTQKAVPGLWVHQGDVLRSYAADHQSTADLAIELPTGTGKTLPGLLIGEWVRRGGDRVAFATPTVQLATQVVATAREEGIPVVQLTGSAKEWSIADQTAYEAGEAIAVVTYNTIFNSHPKLLDPAVLIFDDAHSGEQFVGENYGVRIQRNDTDAYKAVLDAVAPLLPGLLLQRLRDDAADSGSHNALRLLLPSLDQAVLQTLDAALRALPAPQRYDYLMLRGVLGSCCVYLSHGGVQIRPMVPPTFENRIFSSARQRIYLSATLGSGGELERSFGRQSIARMPLTEGTQPRSGRRLFVFPDLVAGGNADALTQSVVRVAEKAVVLSQTSTEKAKATGEWLAPPGTPVYTAEHLRQSLETFADAPKGVLSVANRYDGLDLPGDTCRVVVLDGLPNSYSLQERFLSERADAQATLAERVRTRVIQGAGRCTRGPNDYAVVVVRGADLTRYFSRPEVRTALDAELQAEVEFGWVNSKGEAADDVLQLVTTFLEQGVVWREQGEPALAEFRRDAVKVAPAGSDALMEIADSEVEAWQLASEENWRDASAKLQEAARGVGRGGEATRGYRSLLLFLAAAWLDLASDSAPESARVRELVRQAEAAATRGTWLREMPDIGESEVKNLTGADAAAVAAVAARLSQGIRVDRHQSMTARMLLQLSQTEASEYEAGLASLGGLLGADSFKPKGDGRSDSVWLWDTALWLTFEAKTEEHENATIPLKYVRQVNSQLDQLAADQKVDVPPPGSRSFLVSPRSTVDPQHAPVAHPNLYLVAPAVIAELAADTQTAWSVLATAGVGHGETALRSLVAETLAQFDCLPSQVSDRLSVDRVRPWTDA
jgi:hypothetical protein